MAQKKNYSRYFIILQEDEKGFAFASDKLPSGYAKLEIKNDKCKVSYYVQNLKKDGTAYFMVLICGKKDTKNILNLGELNIDDHGRAEISKEYALENIANTNISADKIVGAAIVKLNEENIISIMSGFSSTDIPDWKNYALVKGDIEEAKVIPVPEKEETREKNMFEVYEEKIEDSKQPEKDSVQGICNEDTNIEQEPVKEEKEDIERDMVEQESAEPEAQGQIEQKLEDQPEDQLEDQLENQRDEDEKPMNEEEKWYDKIPGYSEIPEYFNGPGYYPGHGGLSWFNPLYNTVYPQYEQMDYYGPREDIYSDLYDADYMQYMNCLQQDERDEHKPHCKYSEEKFFDGLIEEFKEENNVCEAIKKCKWFKVPVNNYYELFKTRDFYKYSMIYYPMIGYYPYIRKHQHFLIGYKYDKNNKIKFIIYGIPGLKNRKDQPFEGMSGFVTWVPEKSSERQAEGAGYWLLFYDFRTSTILIPTDY